MDRSPSGGTLNLAQDIEQAWARKQADAERELHAARRKAVKETFQEVLKELGLIAQAHEGRVYVMDVHVTTANAIPAPHIIYDPTKDKWTREGLWGRRRLALLPSNNQSCPWLPSTRAVLRAMYVLAGRSTFPDGI